MQQPDAGSQEVAVLRLTRRCGRNPDRATPATAGAFTDRVIILAYERDGQPLDAQSGSLQLIVSGEKKHARWVRMVKQIRVMDSLWIKE